MVTRYDVISSRLSTSHFLVVIYYSCQAQKITFSRGFNLISKLVKSKMAAKMATIVGDVTGLQQRHHP